MKDALTYAHDAGFFSFNVIGWKAEFERLIEAVRADAIADHIRDATKMVRDPVAYLTEQQALERLCNYINQSFKTQKEAAKSFEVTDGFLSMVLTGKKPITEAMAHRLSLTRQTVFLEPTSRASGSATEGTEMSNVLLTAEQAQQIEEAFAYYKNDCSGAEPSASVFARKVDNALSTIRAAREQERSPLTIEAAEKMGAKGAEPTEAERQLFEAWMKGHCWAVCGEWDGETYTHEAEKDGWPHYQTMLTRQLWAAWRDRAALFAPVRKLEVGLTGNTDLGPVIPIREQQPQRRSPSKSHRYSGSFGGAE